MKYIMFESLEGGKYPVIFPDQIPHVLMSVTVKVVTHPHTLEPVSAGFVVISNCDVRGNSESLGGMPHNETDAARMILGDSVAFIPDAVAASTLKLYREKFK